LGSARAKAVLRMLMKLSPDRTFDSYSCLNLDVSDSYNVEEEVFTVAFSKNNPEVIKINPIPKLIAKKKEVDQVCSFQKLPFEILAQLNFKVP